MKRKQVKKAIFSIVALAFFAFIIFCYTVKFRISDAEVLRELLNENTLVDIDYFLYEGKKVRQILVDKGNDELMILLHGSPSSSSQWIPLVKDTLLSRKVDFLMIDRPGYGYSNFGKPILSVEKQSEIIYLISNRLRDKYAKIYLFGTSYGGTVGTRLLMDYPHHIDGAVLMSSSMAPGEERTYGISYIIEKYPWLFPELIVVANREKMSHYQELKAMEPCWDRISTPLLFIHSTADDLVYPANIPFVLQRLNSSVIWDTVWVKDGEHSLYWSDRDFVKEKLNEFIDCF